MTEEKKSMVPKLRFPGFNETWEQRKLGEVANVLTGYPFESARYQQNGVKLIRGQNVKRGLLDLSKGSVAFWSSFAGLEKYLLESQDILIQMDGALIGKSYAKILPNQLPALLVQRVARVRTSNNNQLNPFLYYALQKDFLRYIQKNKTETAVPHLSLSDIEGFPVSLPETKEIYKVGDFFDHLERYITLHQRKLEGLSKLKKSLLQKMFPKNGQQNPELRFPGLTGAWEQRKLTDLVSFYGGLTYKPTDVKSKGVLVLRSSNVKDGALIDADNVYVDPDVAKSEKVKVGDIVMVVRNGSKAVIGKHAEVKQPMADTVVGAFMAGIRSPCPSFANALLNTSEFDKEIAKNMGATINQLTGYMFKQMVFFMPGKEEQEKIGSLFSTLENTITLHQRKLESLKKLKKSLLQQMFV